MVTRRYFSSIRGGGDEKVEIKSLAPFLLAQYQLEKPTLSQFLLLKRLQKKLLKDKKPLFIGKSDRDTLETMSDFRKLLKVEKSKSDTVNAIWRLQLKQGPDGEPDIVDRPNM